MIRLLCNIQRLIITHILHAVLVISPQFSSMFDYMLSSSRKILVEFPNMHPVTMTTHTCLARDSVDFLMQFLPKSLSYLTLFQQTGRLRVNITKEKSLQAISKLLNTSCLIEPGRLSVQLRFFITPEITSSETPSALLSPSTDEKLLLDQK